MDLALVCCGVWVVEIRGEKNASMVHCNWPNYIQICQHYANKGKKIKQDFQKFDVFGVGSSTHLVQDVSNNGSASYMVIVTFCHFASLQCIFHGGTGTCAHLVSGYVQWRAAGRRRGAIGMSEVVE